MKVSNKVLDAVQALLAGTATDEQKTLVGKWAQEGKDKRAAMAQEGKKSDPE